MKIIIFFALVTLTSGSLFSQSPCESLGPALFQEQHKWGYASENGVIISPQFDLATPFSAEGAVACVSEECGLINQKGAFIGTTWNRHSRPFPEWFSDGLSAASDGEKWGYVDKAGTVIVPFRYEYAGPFEQGMAKVWFHGKDFFIGKDGARVTPEFDGVFEFHEGLAAVEVARQSRLHPSGRHNGHSPTPRQRERH